LRSALAILLLLSCAVLATATPRSETNKGNIAAQQGELDQALLHYKKALEQKGDTSVILYDLGNVMTQSGQFENAEKSYLGSLHPKTTLPQQSETFYNLGNALFGGKKYDQAIGAYVEALKRNPTDDEAKYNLEVAKRMLQQQQKQQQQQQNQDQKQEQKQDQKQRQDKQQEKKQQQEQQQNQQPQARPDKQMSREEAEKMRFYRMSRTR